MKTWFDLMWRNGYIQLFILGAVLSIYITPMMIEESSDPDNSAIIYYLAAGIGPSIALLVAYKGFYQFWKEYKRMQ